MESEIGFGNEAELEDRLSAPSPGLVADLADPATTGDLVILGAGGKMGPSLAHLARRALDAAGRGDRRVIAVSRWSDGELAKTLNERGVETLTFDLNPGADLAGLPDAADVVFMVGTKFGSTQNQANTWAVNTIVPALVAERYADARIAAFSTGNVYPLVSVSEGGCRENDPTGPVGEYAMTCLGRERAFEHASSARGTKVSIIRLNYAVDMRYGVLADIATKVRDGQPIDLTTGHVNVVWQGYANEVALRSLTRAESPPLPLNLTGPETASVRRIARRFGKLFGRDPVFEGTEAPTALLSDAGRCFRHFGYPQLSLHALIEAQANWIERGGVLWDKPTKFERRDGRF